MYDFIQTVLYNNVTHYIFRNVALERPSWSEILDNLNRTIVSNSKIKILDNLGFVYFDAEKMTSVNALLSEIKKTTDKPVSAHCYISLLEVSKTFGRHNDDSDVFFWQVQGKTKWVVEDVDIVSYILEENDVIYIPKGMVHEVFPLGPRAGISFGIDY